MRRWPGLTIIKLSADDPLLTLFALKGMVLKELQFYINILGNSFDCVRKRGRDEDKARRSLGLDAKFPAVSLSNPRSVLPAPVIISLA